MKMGFYCLGISDYEGIVSPAYSVFEIIDEDDIPRYWEYLLKTELYVSEYRKKSKGIQASRMRLYDDYFLPIHTLYPPKDEQHQIVSFLDSKTQKIDKLIEITEQKIELLKEQRTALINQCVTKGLNPNVEMKDSGVEWIGEIPKDWDISKFKYISEIVTGNTPPKANEELHYTDSKKGFLWVKPTSLNKGLNYVNESVEHLTEEGKLATRVIPKDSTMICCIGNTIGKHSISGQELSTNQQINSVIPNQTRLHPYFCLLYANVFTRDLLKWANYVTLPIFTKSDLEDTSFLLPPLEEQTAIVETIRSENRLFDSTIEKESQRIELLKEYRQALISEVVTGKIDVRGL
jgi:type I restriction enzyme S subunit